MPTSIPGSIIAQAYAPKIVATYQDYGFMGNGRQCYNASVTSGSATVTSSDASFNTATDIGKLIIVQSQAAGSPAIRYRGVITGVNSGTSVTVSPTPSVTYTGASLVYGTDDNAAYTLWLAAIKATNGSGLLPGGRPNANGNTGMYCTSLGLVIPNGMTIEGEGRDYPLVQQAPVNGTTIMLIGSLAGASFVQVGDRVNTLSSATPPIYPMEAILKDLNVDALNGASSAVYMYGRRARVKDCTIWRGVAQGVLLGSQNSWLDGCRIGQMNQGHGVNVAAGDCKIVDNDIRNSGNASHQIYVPNAQNVTIQGNHLYKAGGLDSLSSGNAGNNIYITSTGTPTSGACAADISIVGNAFDATWGAQVVLNVAASSEMHSVNINGNHFFNNGLPDNTFPVFQFTVASTGILHGVDTSGNVGVSNQNRVGAYTALFNTSNSGTFAQWSAFGNHGINANAVFAGGAPDAGHLGNSILVSNAASGTTVAYGNSHGTFSGNGNGTTTAYTFNHNLAGTPLQFTLSPTNVAAGGIYAWSATSTQITVTYMTAPISGTGDVTFSWTASL